MKIPVSGKFSDDIFDSAYAAQARLRKLLAETDIGDLSVPLDCFVFFPVILSDELGVTTKSHRSYSTRENAEFSDVEIKHSEWVGAEPSAHLEMMLDALGIALAGADCNHLPGAAATEIIRRLKSARR
jgi:hypothetical protein